MGKKKNKDKKKNPVFNAIDEAMNAIDEATKNTPTTITGSSEVPALETKPDEKSKDKENKSDSGDAKAKDIAAIHDLEEKSEFDLTKSKLTEMLLELKSSGMEIMDELNHVAKQSDFTKNQVDIYNRKKSYTESLSPSDALEIGTMAYTIPLAIKRITDILNDSKISEKEKAAARTKLSKLKKELEIVKLKQAIVAEEDRLAGLRYAQEKENNRKEEAKAQLEELRIKYGDELIKSLIA